MSDQTQAALSAQGSIAADRAIAVAELAARPIEEEKRSVVQAQRARTHASAELLRPEKW